MSTNGPVTEYYVYILPETVVVEVVVTGQRDEATPGRSHRVEDLQGGGVPHLEQTVPLSSRSEAVPQTETCSDFHLHAYVVASILISHIK